MVTNQNRFPELDMFRGLAVVMMIIFHFFVDLSFLGLSGPDPFSGFLKAFGLCTATMFITIAGISAHIKADKTPGIKNQVFVFLKRGGYLILIGFGISLCTWYFLKGEGYVVFGILHLIGTCLILTPVFHRLYYTNLVIAGILLLFPFYIDLPPAPIWLTWVGLHPEGFFSVDYTPLIPWLAPFLIGLFLGKCFYPKEKRGDTSLSRLTRICNPFIVAGKHSLFIYLIHQPVIIILLVILTGKGL